MKKLTEEECLETGGHCWEYFGANDGEVGEIKIRYAVHYPNGEPHCRKCKHCGRIENEEIRWIEKK